MMGPMTDDVDFPTTPAGDRARWYLRQIRTNANGLTEGEVSAHMALASPWEPARAIERFAADDGRPFIVTAVSAATPEEIALTFDYGDGKPFKLSLTVEARPPYRITRTWWARAVPDDIVIRQARATDAPALNDLEVRAPMTLGADTTLIYDRGSDFLAFARLMDENVCFVAERDGELLGIACGAAHDVQIGAREYRVMLLHHLRVPVEHRKLGVFSTLNGHVFGHYDGRTDGAYGYTALDNAEAMRIGGPGTWDAGVFRAVLDCGALAGGRHGRTATPADAPDIVDVLNRCHEREEVYVPHTLSTFEARLSRDAALYDWSRIRIGELGSVLGVWPSGLAVTTIRGEERRETVRAVALDHGFLPGAEDDFERLVASVCADLLDEGHSELVFVTSEGSPAFPLLSRTARQMDPFAFRMAVPEPPGTVERGVYVDPVYF